MCGVSSRWPSIIAPPSKRPHLPPSYRRPLWIARHAAAALAAFGNASARHSLRHTFPSGPKARKASAAAARDLRWRRQPHLALDVLWHHGTAPHMQMDSALPTPSSATAAGTAVGASTGYRVQRAGGAVGVSTRVAGAPASQQLCWLPLSHPSARSAPPSESIAGLPQWLFSQYVVDPYGQVGRGWGQG